METKMIQWFNCQRCTRQHFNGEVLFTFHLQHAVGDIKEMPETERPPAEHVLWIQNIYDQDNTPITREVTLNLVTANEPGYTPLDQLTFPLGEARTYRNDYHKMLGLTDADVDAIEASSMFFENGVRYPENLRHYVGIM